MVTRTTTTVMKSQSLWKVKRSLMISLMRRTRIQVVPDQTSLKTERLATSGKIKSRSLAIFATGDSLRVVTITANTGFIRAAAGQGVTFATLTHESRALTEDKE